VQFLGQELEKFMGILLFCCDKVVESPSIGIPEARENIRRGVPVSRLHAVKLLENVLQCATQAVVNGASAMAVG
jgi:hypothetical protein